MHDQSTWPEELRKSPRVATIREHLEPPRLRDTDDVVDEFDAHEYDYLDEFGFML